MTPAKNACTPLKTLKTSETQKTSTLDRDSWIAVLPEKNGCFGEALP